MLRVSYLLLVNTHSRIMNENDRNEIKSGFGSYLTGARTDRQTWSILDSLLTRLLESSKLILSFWKHIISSIITYFNINSEMVEAWLE